MSRVFFTDRDLGKRFPDILREAGLTVQRHVDHFPHDLSRPPRTAIHRQKVYRPSASAASATPDAPGNIALWYPDGRITPRR